MLAKYASIQSTRLPNGGYVVTKAVVYLNKAFLIRSVYLITSCMLVYWPIALLKDRAVCLALNLDLGSLDAFVVKVLVEPASTMLQLGVWVQTIHPFAVVGHRGPELVQNASIQVKCVPVQVIRIVAPMGEIEAKQRCVTVRLKLMTERINVLVHSRDQSCHVVVEVVYQSLLWDTVCFK